MPRDAHARTRLFGFARPSVRVTHTLIEKVKNVRDGDALRTHVEKDAWTVSRHLYTPRRSTTRPTTGRETRGRVTGRDGDGVLDARARGPRRGALARRRRRSSRVEFERDRVVVGVSVDVAGRRESKDRSVVPTAREETRARAGDGGEGGARGGGNAMRDAMTRERGSVETTGRRMDAVRRRRGEATRRDARLDERDGTRVSSRERAFEARERTRLTNVTTCILTWGLFRTTQSPETRRIVDDLLAVALPDGLSGRDAFEWTFGKCDARHWVDVFARFAEYLRNTAHRVRVNRVGGVTEGDRSRDEDKGAETFRAVNWIADFMREVLENCGEGTAFTHGEAVTAFLEFRETCESVLRLLATATRKSVIGRTMRHEYFTSDAVKRSVWLTAAIDRRARDCGRAVIDANERSFPGTCDDANRARAIVRDVRCEFVEPSRLDGEPATYRVEYELFARCGDEATTTTGRGRRGRGESSQSVDGGITLCLRVRRRAIADGKSPTVVNEREFYADIPGGLSLAETTNRIARAKFKARDDEPNCAGGAFDVETDEFGSSVGAVHAAFVMELWIQELARTREGCETCARLSCLAQHVIINMGKLSPYAGDPNLKSNEFENLVEDAQSSALALLGLIQVDLGITRSSDMRRDAMNCLSAYTNDRVCGFQVCQIIRRRTGPGVLAESLSAMSTSVTSQSATEDDIDSGVIRDARSLMHLLGILSTTTPGCGAIRDAELLPMLISLVEQTRVEMLPVVIDAVHTIESYLDYQSSAVTGFRELQGLEMLSKRMHLETRAALEELRAAGHMDESTERKRKIDSLSSLEDFETQATTTATTLATTTASRNDAPKYVRYHRRVLIKALMRTMAYTCFSTGGLRSRVPGLADGTLTDTLATVLRYPLKFGPGVSSLASNLLCDVIHNEPTCYATLDEAGIIDAFLKFITETMWPIGNNKNMAKVLCAVPTTINAICLNEQGQAKVIKSSALTCLRTMFLDKSFPMNSDTAKVVGTGINEALRHIPALQGDGVQVMHHILSDAREAIYEKMYDPDAYQHAFVSKDVIDQMPLSKRLQNISRFMDGVLATSHMCERLVNVGVVEILLEMVICPMPIEFASCSSYQSISVACKAIINPIDANAYSVELLDSSDGVMRACAVLVKQFTRSSTDVCSQLAKFAAPVPVDENMDQYASYDIYCNTISNKSKRPHLKNETAFCEQVKSLCTFMAGYERLCDLFSSVIQQMPAMSCKLMHSREETQILFRSALEAFSRASNLEAMFHKVLAKVDSKQQPYSPVWWLCVRADHFMRSISALFASVTKVSTTMRRRKDLGPCAQKFIKCSGDAVWEMACEVKRTLSQSTVMLNSQNQSETDRHQSHLRAFVALSYEIFFDDRRNAPNGVMINYAARCGLFSLLYAHFEATVELTQQLLQSGVKRTETEDVAVTSECYNTVRSFARLFSAISDVKLITSTNTYKLALSTDLPEHASATDIHMPTYSHVPDAFTNARSGMDWIHCSLNDALKCLWRQDVANFAALASQKEADLFLQCFLNILGGTSQAAASDPRRSPPAPRAVPRPPPRPFVPSEDMIASIVEMGFSRGHAHHAITAVNGQSVERAMEYLLTRPMDDVPHEAPPPPATPVDEANNAAEPMQVTSTEATDPSTAPKEVKHMHAVQDRLPGVRELVDAMFAYYRINAEKGATFLLKLVENHELSTLSRREYIDKLITEVVRSRKRDVAADVVNECKLYAFMDALSRQGDEVVREVVWKRASMIESLVKEFCQAIKSACQSKMENIPMFLATMTTCIHTASCVQKVGDGTYSKFGYLSKNQIFAVADACIACLSAFADDLQRSTAVDNVDAESMRNKPNNSGDELDVESMKRRDMAFHFDASSIQAAILDLLANLSRDSGVADRVIAAKNPVAGTKNFTDTLFTYFWNYDHDSVCVILRHLLDDKKSLQSAMELEIVKSITKPPLGRDFKVTLKTFCTAMKHTVERDFETFQKAFANVAEIKSLGKHPDGERRYVVPKRSEIKEMPALPDVKNSKSLKVVLEVLLATAIDGIRDKSTAQLERQAAAFRLLTEIVEVHPGSVKLMMKIDGTSGMFRTILRDHLPRRRKPAAKGSEDLTGVWCGNENAVFFLATVCVNNAKARSKIIEQLLSLLEVEDHECADKVPPKHALIDFLHALMDYGLARGYQSGERIRNRAIFNLQQGVVKTMYALKVPKRIIELIAVLRRSSDQTNPGFMRVILAVLEALVTRSAKTKRENRLARITHAVRQATAAAERSADQNAASTDEMLENLLAHAAGGQIQVARIEDYDGEVPAMMGDGTAFEVDDDMQEDDFERMDGAGDVEMHDDADEEERLDDENGEGAYHEVMVDELEEIETDSEMEEDHSGSEDFDDAQVDDEEIDDDSDASEDEDDSEDEEEEEEEEEVDFYSSDVDHVNEDGDREVVLGHPGGVDDMSDDGLYDEDADDYDAYGVGSEEDEDDEEEEGDFEEPRSSSSIVSSHSDFRILPRAMMNEQETNVSTRELERWLANDYASAMAGIDPRVEAQSIREVEIAGGRRVSVDETLTGPSPDSEFGSMNNQRDHFFRSSARENSVTQTNSWHTWGLGEDETATFSQDGVNVQRVGSNLNITLSTPLDFSSRSRSLHNVLTSISGEMARLAVRPTRLEFFDPLSSAKAILWLGDGTYQAQSPQDFKVRDQTCWSLDGRHARSSFWCSTVHMSVGESVALDETLLMKTDVNDAAAEASPGSASKGKEPAVKEDERPKASDESPEERTARQREIATQLNITSNQLTLVSEDLRDGFLEANRLVARAREQAGDTTRANALTTIEAEFLTAMPRDIQQELIRSTTAQANRILSPSARPRPGPGTGASNRETIANSLRAFMARVPEMPGMPPQAVQGVDIDRIDTLFRHPTPTREENSEGFKPFKANVELDVAHVNTLLAMYRSNRIESKDTVNKICVNLCVVDMNRNLMLKKIFEEVFNVKGRNADNVRDDFSNTVIRRYLILLSQLLSRSKHVQAMSTVPKLSRKWFYDLLENADSMKETTTMSADAIDSMIDDAAETTHLSSDGVATIDMSLLVILLRLLIWEPKRYDVRGVELCVTCLDNYLSKHATLKGSLKESAVFSEVLPKYPHLVSDIISILEKPHLSSQTYDKVHSVLKKLCQSCPSNVQDEVLARLHRTAIACSETALQNISVASFDAGKLVDFTDVKVNNRIIDARKEISKCMPLLLRLTRCFTFVLSFVENSTDEVQNQLVSYGKNLRPLWKMLHTYVEQMEGKDQHDHNEHSQAVAVLTDGIKAYMMIGSKIMPFIESEITRQRRDSGAFLPSHSLRVPSPVIGIRPPSSTGILQRTSSHMLETLHALQRGSTHVLESLSEQNATTKQGSEIYALMADIWAFVEAHKELLNKQLKRSPQLLSEEMKLLLHNPRLLDFSVKRAEVRSRIKKLRDRQGRERPENRQLHIRRAHVLEDSFRHLSNRSVEEIRGKLSIVFVGEEGLDGGGLIKEWFSILAREIFKPDIALFELSHDGCYKPNADSKVHPEFSRYFRFVGRLVGKVLLDDILLNAYFTRPIYKHLLGQVLTYEDMEGVDPDYFKSLKWILENSIEGVMEYTFSESTEYFGKTEVHDLIENGRNIPVTDENKAEYVNLVSAYRMTNAVKEQLAAMVQGFEEVIPKETISILNAAELELMISGTPDIDIEDWRANTEYTGFTVGSKQIQWFWDVVRELSKDDLARLLMFCTGTSKVPLEGFSALQGMQGPQRFSIHRQHADDAKLPSAHTCFNQLDLHEYSSKEILRERLLLAITEGCEGFGFV